MALAPPPHEIDWLEFAPYFFRDEARQLYACHHRPELEVSDLAPVLLCNSLGHEYERCHRAFRQLAIQLAKAGHHAIRFDYTGTGNSASDYAETETDQWRADIADMVEECKRLTGRRRISVVGLRLGANLAAQVVATRTDVEDLVLYAPIGDGKALLGEWGLLTAKAGHGKEAGQSAEPGEMAEVAGFPVTSRLRDDLLHGLSMPAPNPNLRRILILAENDGDPAVGNFPDSLQTPTNTVEISYSDALAVWRRNPDEGIVPYKALRRIVRWLSEDA